MAQAKLTMTHNEPKTLTMTNYDQKDVDNIYFWARHLSPDMVKTSTCSDCVEILDADKIKGGVCTCT